MAFECACREAAENRARELNERGAYRGLIEYRAALYPDGQRPRLCWSWGVARHELNYGKNGEERFLGFVWF